MEFLRYKTSYPAGDLISMLAGLKQAYAKTRMKIIIYQRLNAIGVGYPNAVHPFQDDEGMDICMGEYMFNILRPLLIAQEYIEDFIVYEGQEFDFDLDRLRMKVFTNKPKGSLHRAIFYGFPDLTCDLSKKWIDVRSDIEMCESELLGKQYSVSIKDKVVINFTERYRNRTIDYFFLKQYGNSRFLFAGLPKEHERFCNEWKWDVPFLKTSDLFEFAEILASCKFFLGNASVSYHIAEAMKIPRILETFELFPHVIPIGEDAYDFYSQAHVEYCVRELFNTK